KSVACTDKSLLADRPVPRAVPNYWCGDDTKYGGLFPESATAFVCSASWQGRSFGFSCQPGVSFAASATVDAVFSFACAIRTTVRLSYQLEQWSVALGARVRHW